MELLPDLRALVTECTEATWEDRIVPAWQAWWLAAEIRPVLGDDPALTELLDQVTSPMKIESSPPGAEVKVRPYGDANAEWLVLGKTPVSARPRQGFLEVQLRGDSLDPVDDGWSGPLELGYEMANGGESPAGVVLVSGSGRNPIIWLTNRRELWGEDGSIEIPPFYIDRLEATNAEYKKFVDAGGYRGSRHWPPLEADGKAISWADGGPTGPRRSRTGAAVVIAMQRGRLPLCRTGQVVGFQIGLNRDSIYTL